MTGLDINVGNGLRVHNLMALFGTLKSKSSEPDNGNVEFNNDKRMAMRDYVRHARTAFQVPMNVIRNAAVRYANLELRMYELLQLVGSRKS